MAIRTIRYMPKVTMAKTQYVEIEPNDMLWLESELMRYLTLFGELDGNRNEDIRQVMKQWWYKRSSTLPKGVEGQNSPLTFTSGLLNNLLYKGQRDLSTKYLDAIENISSQVAMFDEAIEELNITPTKNNKTSIKFVLMINSFTIPKSEK